MVYSDIENIPDIVYGKETSTRLDGKIYRSTNENLTKILSPFNFKNKKVLTVTASGDQPFSCMYLGANKLDMFDSNINAYYYYYLRKWNMLYTHEYYLSANNNAIINSLEFNNNSPEEIEIKNIWLKLLNTYKCPLYYSDLFYRAIADYEVPFKSDVEKMIEILKNQQPNFYHFNLFKGNEEFENNNKYDIIILSNILEYLFEYEDSSLEDEVFKRLYKLLNTDGIIVSSNILDYDYEDDINKELFDYELGVFGKSPINHEEAPISYVLRKK